MHEHSGGEPIVDVFEYNAAIPCGIAMLGHLSIKTAINIHGLAWRWMTDAEHAKYLEYSARRARELGY